MKEKNYNMIRLSNGVKNAVNEALADILITRLEVKIKQYKEGDITASEFLEFHETINA